MSLLLTQVLDEAFEDQFKPISRGEYLGRLGGVKNPDGTYTLSIGRSQWTFDPDKVSKYPILSNGRGIVTRRGIVNVGILDAIPARARAFGPLVDILEELGVKWIQFSQLKNPHRGSFTVNSGLQAVGSYAGLVIMVETKVGVGTASSGYYVYIGPGEDLGTGNQDKWIRGCTKTKHALEVIMKRVKKLTEEYEENSNSDI